MINKNSNFAEAYSNLGNLLKEIGKVNAISNIYETPALGFVGADFLNLCIPCFLFLCILLFQLINKNESDKSRF